MADITMPQLGETVTEGTITRWFKHVGETVAEDEVLFEVSTDKVDSEVPSPASGVLSEILVAEGDTVEVGTVLARVGDAGDVATAAPAAAPENAPAEPAPAAEPQSSAEVVPEPTAAQAPPPTVPAPSAESEPGSSSGGGRLLSPVVRRLLSEHDLDAAAIVGSGVGGRITRADVEMAIKASGATVAPQSSLPAPVTATAPASPQAAPAAPTPPPAPTVGGDRTVPLNNIRKRTGEHMVMSKSTSPHVLTAIEVDYENVERVRRRHGAAFKAEEGTSLTYLPFIAWALSDALRDYPHMNASVGDGELIIHGKVNLAIAVDLNFDGLLAPVVRDIESKRLRAIAREVSQMATRARAKDLGIDDLMGGTFTITNAGSYGTMMQFPIINQPQVAILSTDGIKRRPVVVTDEHGDESIAIHSTGVLALAWDHRAFDGAYAAAFLNRLREIIETHDWEREL